jgi:hypothetical protein
MLFPKLLHHSLRWPYVPRPRHYCLSLAPRSRRVYLQLKRKGLIVRITRRSAEYDNSIVYLDGRKIVDYVWADDQTGEGMEITGKQKLELRKGKQVQIVLNAGSSRF